MLDVWLDLCFCMWMSFCSSTIYWRDYLCFIVLPLLHCERSVDNYLSGSISELCILLYWSICLSLFLFSPKQTVFLTITLCCPCILGVSILFFFNKCSLFQSFVAPCKFHNQFANIHRITFPGLDWDWIKSTHQVGKNWHIDNIESPYPWTRNISPFI